MKKQLTTQIITTTAGEDVEFTIGSDNIFADLDLPDAEELLLKSQLIGQIGVMVRERGWTPAQAAEATGLTQAKISNLLRGRLEGFSVEKLFEILNRLGYDVEVRIKPRKRAMGQARTTLIAA